MQFLETPRAICTKYGLPYKGIKSTVYTIFKKRYITEYNPFVHEFPFSQGDCCLIAEGMNIIHKQKPQSGH